LFNICDDVRFTQFYDSCTTTAQQYFFIARRFIIARS